MMVARLYLPGGSPMIGLSLIALGLAIASFYFGTHLTEEAEGITLLALLIALICLLVSLLLTPWFIKLVLIGLVFTSGTSLVGLPLRR
jgi:Zn-dependent protease with chaperone function